MEEGDHALGKEDTEVSVDARPSNKIIKYSIRIFNRLVFQSVQNDRFVEIKRIDRRTKRKLFRQEKSGVAGRARKGEK